MSYGTRSYVGHGQAMFLAVAYNADGMVVGSAGPYSTRRPAAAQRRSLLRQRGAVVAQVESAYPMWFLVPGTEVRP